MIPKVIHYCWFGKGSKPRSVQKCIQSWKKHLPDYKIIEWNEENFDITSMTYVKEAYALGKYAFVSDVARLVALYRNGGIYFDTDVEVTGDFNQFLYNKTFMGFETEDRLSTAIIGCEKELHWIRDMIEDYKNRHFVRDGVIDTTTNVVVITEYMKKKGLKKGAEIVDIYGIGRFYPSEYFSPKSYYDGIIYETNKTVAIHHFTGSWQQKSKFRRWLEGNISARLLSKLRLIKFRICNLIK